jgi:hypothetical protein
VEKGSLTFVIRLLETSIVSAKFRSSNIYQKDGKLSELCHADINILISFMGFLDPVRQE